MCAGERNQGGAFRKTITKDVIVKLSEALDVEVNMLFGFEDTT
jgi:plasmid maintenance system antidote protein VapI